MSVGLWLAVGLLGGAGAVARFGLDALVSARASGGIPWGTLAVNTSGAGALGVLAGAALHGRALTLAGTAALGAYTTFSTWMLESQRLGEQGRTKLIAVNLALGVTAGLGAAALGRAVAQAL
ncbi:MAG: fluoride efflux transporter CrcB [Actinomycetota bacterium]|nr:fluoride efflux transporter CrcB [Actinomycetota bacterium]